MSTLSHGLPTVDCAFVPGSCAASALADTRDPSGVADGAGERPIGGSSEGEEPFGPEGMSSDSDSLTMF